MRIAILTRATVTLVVFSSLAQGAPIGAAFTYQGDLYDNDQPVSDTCDFEFTLWDAGAGGAQVGGVIAQSLDVDAGQFTTLLDFGSTAFAGEARWLQIDVCCPSPCSPALTPLEPRLELTPSTYAIRASRGVGPPNALEVEQPTGNVGIGTDNPLKNLHIMEDDLHIGDDDFRANEHLIIEAAQPGLVLVGEQLGAISSALMFREVYEAARFNWAASDEWRLAKQNFLSGGSFQFQYTDDNANFTTLLDLTPSGTLRLGDATSLSLAIGAGSLVAQDNGGPSSLTLNDSLTIDAAGHVGIGTDTPAEQLHVAGNLTVDGTITGAIDVSQITGLLGDGFTLQFPDVLDNTARMEFQSIGFGEAVVLVGPGYDIDRVPGFDGVGNPLDTPGFAMEHPCVFEASGSFAADLEAYFDNYIDPANSATYAFSLMVDRLDGSEAFRWNFYDFAPDFYEPGVDGRTRFHFANWHLPDTITQVEAIVGPGPGDPFGDAASLNPATDTRIEIEGLAPGYPAFYPEVAVDYDNRTITLTHDIVEGKELWPWVEFIVAGTPDKRSASWILDPGPPEVRYNFYGCFPIKYEQFTGFGLDTKIKARVTLSFDVWEVVSP